MAVADCTFDVKEVAEDGAVVGQVADAVRGAGLVVVVVDVVEADVAQVLAQAVLEVALSSHRSLRSSPEQVLGADSCPEDRTETAHSCFRWSIRQQTSRGSPNGWH